MAKPAPLQINLTPAALEALELLGRNLGRLADVLAPLVDAETNTQPKTEPPTPHPFVPSGVDDRCAYAFCKLLPSNPVHTNDHSVTSPAPYAREDVDDLAIVEAMILEADEVDDCVKCEADDVDHYAHEWRDDEPTDRQSAVAGDDDAAGESDNPQRHHETTLRTERDELRLMLTNVMHQRDRLNEHARNLQRQLDAEPQPFLQANAQLREENARLATANATLSEKVIADHDRITTLLRQLDDQAPAQAELLEQQQRIDQLLEDRDAIEEDRDAIEAERDQLEQQLADARRDYEQLGQRTHDLEVEVNRLKVYERAGGRARGASPSWSGGQQ